MDTDVLIIGAGPAGCAAASKLSQLGIASVVLEKCVFPRFVIGESLLPKCIDHLKEIGAFEIIEQANFQFKNGARFIMDKTSCDFDFSEKSTEGWNWTWQVKRAEFDQLLVDHIEKLGVEVQFNAAVTKVVIQKDKAVVNYELNGESKTITSKYIIDASGYGRVLPRLLGLTKASSLEERGAHFAHITSEKLWNWIDIHKVNYVISSNSLYAWIIPFADKTISVGIVGNLHHFSESKDAVEYEKMLALIPALYEHIDDLEYIMQPNLIRGFSSSVSNYYGDKYVLIGNTTEFLDPIFSSGVTIAMESGIKSAMLVAKTLNGESVDWKVEYEDYMRKGVSVFKSFVEAWYSRDLFNIFFNDEKPEVFRRYICSVLAGYVWDEENPLVTKHKRMLTTMGKLVAPEFKNGV